MKKVTIKQTITKPDPNFKPDFGTLFKKLKKEDAINNANYIKTERDMQDIPEDVRRKKAIESLDKMADEIIAENEKSTETV